jgi:hypothetical protein
MTEQKYCPFHVIRPVSCIFGSGDISGCRTFRSDIECQQVTTFVTLSCRFLKWDWVPSRCAVRD